MSLTHNDICIYCPRKKLSVFIKYKSEDLYAFYKATNSFHRDNYLINEFESKQFWRPEAKNVEWKIRYQSAKYRPKIKGL